MPEWEDRDSILRSAVCQPNLILSKGLVKTMGIHLIGQLCTDIKDFNPANITWILSNIKCMPKLKYFLLNAALQTAKIVMVFNVLFTRCQAASQRLRRNYISGLS